MTIFLGHDSSSPVEGEEGGITGGQEANTLSAIDASVANGIHRLNFEGSSYKGEIRGGVIGNHDIKMVGALNTAKIDGTRQPITIVPGANVTVNGLDVDKNIDGNSWNSSFSSTLSFDPNKEDFAISWLIESVTGTIREMGGLDNNPAENNSYNRIEFAMYQVNGYVYPYVYESGSATIMPGVGNTNLQVGDRIGVKCINNVVTYFLLRAGIETEIYISTKKATEPLFFKGAFNRGASSSGASSIGGVEWHTEKKVISKTITISGGAGAEINESDIESVKTLGVDIQEGATYSDIQFIKDTGPKFTSEGQKLGLSVFHNYSADIGQSDVEINFN